MDKKNYVKPNMVVVKLRYQEHLLDANTNANARSLKWSETFDYE
jgi:hypothetical protein